MAEKVLNLDLSGAEVKRAILDKISTQLDRDCFLNDSTSYGGFEAENVLKVKLHDVGRDPEVNITVRVSHGQVPEGIEPTVSRIEIDGSEPTRLRVETGQDVPVATRTRDGEEVVRKVRYSRERATK